MVPRIALAIVLATSPACLDLGGDDGPDDTVETVAPGPEAQAVLTAACGADCIGELAPLLLDSCDDPSYTDAPWLETTSSHLILRYPAESAPAADIAQIVANRERAYEQIRATLGVAEQPTITIYLSPNRLAAEAHSLGMGVAFEDEGRIEVIYTGAADGFESVRYGHELSHVLADRLVGDGRQGLRILDEGVAEMLDQSRRNRHDSYLREARAFSARAADDLTAFDAGDIWGRQHERAGSLAQYLVDTFGWGTMVELFEATAVSWDQGCYRHPTVGCVDSPEKLAAVLDAGLRAVAGTGWQSVRAGWAEALADARLNLADTTLTAADRSAVRSLLAHMDHAMTAGDAAEYRTTLDGFYCDWGGEPERQRIAAKATSGGAEVQSKLLELQDIDMTNFPGAIALVERTDDSGATQEMLLWLERLPEVGWRVTWGPDWQ